jgi:membrane protein YdbS with pleckstrin-like domain
MIQELQRSRVPQAPIITVRPSPRMVRFYYLAAAGFASVLAIATILSIAFMPFELKILYCLYIAGGSLTMVAPLYYQYVKLRSSIYTVMDDYVAVEADMGIFGRSTQQIPIVYIRDVSTKFLPLPQLRNIGDVTVKATNGDFIKLEDIENAETVRETIWQLVHAAASRYGGRW